MNDHDAIIVVSGLPRSGTSLMMSMLEAGGLELLTDGARQADADNPNGYFEFERVKALETGDHEWLEEALGKVVKVVSAQLEHLPLDRHYTVIFMSRRLTEVLASQDVMLVRRGRPVNLDDQARIAELMERHVGKVRVWLSSQPNFRVMDVNYNEMLDNPLPQIAEVNRFLGGMLDQDRMAAAIRPDLYRNRA
jgi:hypothetical protein